MSETPDYYELLKTLLIYGPAYFVVLVPASHFIKAQLAPFIVAMKPHLTGR